MKKVFVTSVIAGIAVLCLSVGVASAWAYNLNGSGVCEPDGSYRITWVIDNTSEPEVLEIKQSNRAVVKAGDKVPARQKKEFIEHVDGSQAASYTLSVRGDWKSDRSNMKRDYTVRLKTACEQPQLSAEEQIAQVKENRAPNGSGAALLSEQVAIVPKGAVNAGKDGTNYAVAAIGFVMSILAIAYGVVTLAKMRATK